MAIPTFRRPGLLQDLLPVVVEQAAELDPAATVVVADNDPAGSARTVVETWADRGVRYVHEPQPGLAAVRNRLLDEAAGHDLIVFIDDDETPTPGWLSTLVAGWTDWDCTAVCGPVRSVFDSEPDPWLAGTGVFDRIRRPDGTLLHGGASNNLLLDLRRLAAAGIRFDPAFGETGGEDTMLTHSIVAAGGEIRWSDEAEVLEQVPAARLTRDWVARRVIRTSNSWARVELKIGTKLGRKWRSRASVALRVPYLAGRGVFGVVVATARRNAPAAARAACDLYCSVGVGRALLGSVSAEYRRPAARG